MTYNGIVRKTSIEEGHKFEVNPLIVQPTAELRKVDLAKVSRNVMGSMKTILLYYAVLC